jgi:cell wall-associated NlpC family hydrolase
MKTPALAVFIALVPWAALAAAERAPVPKAAVVINTAENMHRHSNDRSEVVSQALLGTNVKILKTERNSDGEDWYQVETPDTYRGWVIGPSLRFLKDGEEPYGSRGKIFAVTALLANIYWEDDVTKRKPVKVAPISSTLEVSREKSERWLEIILPCGTKAWIQKGDGEVHEAPWSWPRRSTEEMVALAKRFLGLPYLWGGTSPLGFDCAGLVQIIYKLADISIPRDGDVQFGASGLVEIPSGQEAVGDLVFFGNAKNAITHVGMMISAEEFISAAVHERPVVQISRLSDPYWQALYKGARRAKR